MTATAAPICALRERPLRSRLSVDDRCDLVGLSDQMMDEVFPRRSLGTFGTILYAARADRALLGTLHECERTGAQASLELLRAADRECQERHRAAHRLEAWLTRVTGAGD